MMFVLHEVLNMTSIIVCIGVSTPPQNVLNMEAVHHDPSPIQNLDFSKTPCYNFVPPSLIKFLVKILSLSYDREIRLMFCLGEIHTMVSIETIKAESYYVSTICFVKGRMLCNDI